MRRVAILIAASRNDAFYSQIAAIALAVRALPWRRWQPAIHAYFDGPLSPGDPVWQRWAEHLRDVHVVPVLPEAFVRDGNWAQVDATFEHVPDAAHVLMSLDADTLPVAGFEDLLDVVADEDLIAGVMAHYPPPGIRSPSDWERLAKGLISQSLSFEHQYSLVGDTGSGEPGSAPFYVNGGVVFYGQAALSRLVPVYRRIRKQVVARLPDPGFSGQVATTLAAAEARLTTTTLPMRFNFPNDPMAMRQYPDDASTVVIHHYLRTDHFNRHRIFASRTAFDDFLALPLEGPNLVFQDAVRRLCSGRYPFS